MNNSFLRCVAGCCVAVWCGVAATAAEPVTLDTVRQSAGEWLKVRAEISRIETEWANDQQLMASLAQGLAERATALEMKRDLLRAKTAKDRDELAAAEADNTALSGRLSVVEAELRALAKDLLELRPALPPRLSAALELPYRSLGAAETPPSERMQVTMAVLNRCLQFDRSLNADDEVLTFEAGGPARQVETIYWGLSQGFALDRPAGKVWRGAPGPQGWQWVALTDADTAGRVGRLVDIYRGKTEPAFVPVPATAATLLPSSPNK